MTAQAPAMPAGRLMRMRSVVIIPLLIAVLIGAAVIAAAIGAAGIPLARLPAALGLTAGDPAFVIRAQLVLWSIRLPRIAMAAIVGALLAGSGTIMQGLFRNPLADPALVGVLSGGALAAAGTIVIGDRWLAGNGMVLPFEILPVAAFEGALATTSLLYRIATRASRTSIAIFLLGGLAIAALANAGIGLLVFLADDRQLRDITFWMLGSLSGATWVKVAATVPFLLAVIAALPFIARGLDLLVLGEAEAFHMGIEVERLKRLSILLIAAATGAAVSVAGVIGFIGIVAPHLLRLLVGPRPSAAVAVVDVLRCDPVARRRHVRARAGGAGRSANRNPHRGDRRAVLPCAPAAAAQPGRIVSAVLDAQGVSVRAGERFLLRDVALRAAAGERIALVGPNGAGKSTLIRVLSGDLRAHAGAVRLKGQDIRSYSSRILALHRALLSQNISVTFPFTVAEMVRMGAGDRGGAAVDALVERALAEVDLSDFRDRIITTLSGGEQGRAHFARVLVQLACGETALLLDEPTTALDLRHQLDMAASAKRCAARGTAVIAILHDLNLAALFAERVIVLHDGAIAADGAPAETITDAMLGSVFGVAANVGKPPPVGVPFVLPYGARSMASKGAEVEDDLPKRPSSTTG